MVQMPSSRGLTLCVLVCVCPPGDDCRVRDPRSGYVFDLSSLSGRDFKTLSAPYQYHLSVCGGLQRGICTHKDTGNEDVSSCQVEGSTHRIAGACTNPFLL